MKAKILYFVILVLMTSFLPANADVIILKADAWCPYNCQPNSDNPGYIVEIAKTIFEKQGHEIKYELLNWARAIMECRNGGFNGIIASAKGDAPDFVFPEESVGYVKNAVWIKKDSSWKYTGIESLKTIAIGIINDYDYGEFAQYFQENEKTKYVQIMSGEDALEKNIKKLEKGRVDAVMEDINVFKTKAKEMGMSELFKVAEEEGVKIKFDEIYIAFSPANPKSQTYAKILSDGIINLRTSGQLQTIMSKYGLTDWK